MNISNSICEHLGYSTAITTRATLNEHYKHIKTNIKRLSQVSKIDATILNINAKAPSIEDKITKIGMSRGKKRPTIAVSSE